MKIFLILIFFIFQSAFAYVPTVESLFRHGGNPDVTSSSVVLNVKITKNNVEDGANSDSGYFKIIISKVGELFKISQAQFENESFSDSAMIAQNHLSSYSPFNLKGDTAELEKGIFWGLTDVIFFNHSKTLLHFLKTIGIPVQLNTEILNREKIDYLVEYKKYLVSQSKNNKKREANPLKPDDFQERVKVEKIMNESIYVDSKQVQLVKNGEDISWSVDAGNFYANISHEMRHPMRVKYKAGSQFVEFELKEYMQFDGVHYAPKEIYVKTLDGESYNLELLKVKYFSEKEEDISKRILKWENYTKEKQVSQKKPLFLI